MIFNLPGILATLLALTGALAALNIRRANRAEARAQHLLDELDRAVKCIEIAAELNPVMTHPSLRVISGGAS